MFYGYCKLVIVFRLCNPCNNWCLLVLDLWGWFLTLEFPCPDKIDRFVQITETERPSYWVYHYDTVHFWSAYICWPNQNTIAFGTWIFKLRRSEILWESWCQNIAILVIPNGKPTLLVHCLYKMSPLNCKRTTSSLAPPTLYVAKNTIKR